MMKAIVRGIFAVAFAGLSLTGLLGISVQGHDLLVQDNSAMARMRQDPTCPAPEPDCTWRF